MTPEDQPTDVCLIDLDADHVEVEWDNRYGMTLTIRAGHCNLVPGAAFPPPRGTRLHVTITTEEHQ